MKSVSLLKVEEVSGATQTQLRPGMRDFVRVIQKCRSVLRQNENDFGGALELELHLSATGWGRKVIVLAGNPYMQDCLARETGGHHFRRIDTGTVAVAHFRLADSPEVP